MLLPQRSHVSHLGGLWVCGLSYIWMDHVAHLDIKHDVFITRMWVISLSRRSHVSHLSGLWVQLHINESCRTCLIQMCDMTHSDVWHDSFGFVTWLIHEPVGREFNHIQLNHVVHMDESCPKPLRCDTYEWVMSLSRIYQVSHLSGLGHDSSICNFYM